MVSLWFHYGATGTESQEKAFVFGDDCGEENISGVRIIKALFCLRLKGGLKGIDVTGGGYI
jgi:hypothetical protein